MRLKTDITRIFNRSNLVSFSLLCYLLSAEIYLPMTPVSCDISHLSLLEVLFHLFIPQQYQNLPWIVTFHRALSKILLRRSPEIQAFDTYLLVSDPPQSMAVYHHRRSEIDQRANGSTSVSSWQQTAYGVGIFSGLASFVNVFFGITLPGTFIDKKLKGKS